MLNNEFDFNIQFAIQEIPNDRLKPLGTSDAVYQTMKQIPKLKQSSFCVCNSDNLYSVNAFNLIKNNEYTNAFLAFLVFRCRWTLGSPLILLGGPGGTSGGSRRPPWGRLGGRLGVPCWPP